VTVDWFLLAAQLINFALLLVLLRVFLYKPVLNVMEQREEHLALAWSEAERVQAEAQAEAAELAAARAGMDRERRRRLELVEAEAERLRAGRLREVEAETAAFRASQGEALEEGRKKAVAALQDRSAELLLSELRATLDDLADDDLERRTTAVFARRLRELEPAHVAELRAAALEAAPVIATAFELGEAQRRELAELVNDVTSTTTPPSFVIDDRLLFGVELTVGAVRVAVSGYERLAALEAGFDQALADLEARLRAGGSGEA